MERSKNRTNHSFFTKTCEQRLYAFRSVSINKKESGSSLSSDSANAPWSRALLLLPSSPPPLKLRLRNRAWGRTPLAVYKPGIRVTNAMAKLPPGWGTSCPYPLSIRFFFLKLYTMGDERRCVAMKVVEPVHIISAKGTGPWSSLTHIKKKEGARRHCYCADEEALDGLGAEGRSSSLTSTRRESPLLEKRGKDQREESEWWAGREVRKRKLTRKRERKQES